MPRKSPSWADMMDDDEPIAKPTTELIAKPTAELTPNAVAKPAAELTPDAVAKPAVKPAAEPTTEPAVKPAAEPTPELATKSENGPAAELSSDEFDIAELDSDLSNLNPELAAKLQVEYETAFGHLSRSLGKDSPIIAEGSTLIAIGQEKMSNLRLAFDASKAARKKQKDAAMRKIDGAKKHFFEALQAIKRLLDKAIAHKAVKKIEEHSIATMLLTIPSILNKGQEIPLLAIQFLNTFVSDFSDLRNVSGTERDDDERIATVLNKLGRLQITAYEFISLIQTWREKRGKFPAPNKDGPEFHLMIKLAKANLLSCLRVIYLNYLEMCKQTGITFKVPEIISSFPIDLLEKADGIALAPASASVAAPLLAAAGASAALPDTTAEKRHSFAAALSQPSSTKPDSPEEPKKKMAASKEKISMKMLTTFLEEKPEEKTKRTTSGVWEVTEGPLKGLRINNYWRFQQAHDEARSPWDENVSIYSHPKFRDLIPPEALIDRSIFHQPN